jgi:YVTN family beta-propeller protein
MMANDTSIRERAIAADSRSFHWRGIGWRIFRTLRLLLFAALALSVTPAFGQDWVVTKTIAVGEVPERAALSGDGRWLYVSNRVSGTVSVIDTAAGEVKATIKVGDSAGTIVASHDGQRVYVLAHRAGAGINFALGIINTADESVRFLPLPGERWDELAITRDDRQLYLTNTVDGINRFNGAVYVMRLADDQLEPVIQDDSGCPTGVALSKDERRVYVSYQCFGPGGYMAHDAIGVYEVPSYRQISAITGLANVGGEIAASPDGTTVWIQGIDACSRPDYPHEGCATVPSRVVNVIDASKLKLRKTYGFSLEDGNGRISFSPNGNAFIGDGIYLKEVATNDLETVKRIPIASTGEVAFQADGKTAYATVTDKNVVDVLEVAPRGTAPAAGAGALTLQTVINVMLKQNCAEDAGVISAAQSQIKELESVQNPTKEQIELIGSLRKVVNNCYLVRPERVASVLAERGVVPAKAQGKAPTIKADTNVYSTVIEELASSGTPADLSNVPRLLDAKTDQEYSDSGRVEAVKKQLNSLYAIANPSEQQKESMKQLQKQIREMGSRSSGALNDVEIRDVTGRLGLGSNRLQKELENFKSSALVLYTIIGDKSYHTILVAPDGAPTSWEGFDHAGHAVNRDELRKLAMAFRDSLQAPNHDPLPLGKELFRIIIGGHEAELERAKTLVWVLDDDLRYIPMAALYDEKNERYLVERYSNVVLTKSDAFQSNEEQVPLRALAAGVSESREGLPALPGVAKELDSIFYSEGTRPAGGFMPARILVNGAFTPYALRAGLRGSYSIVHIASHFVFDDQQPDQSYLLLGDGKLSLAELNDPVNGYSFKGVRLVTLSACDTAKAAGSGNGIEIQSLGEILDSGAWSVMATLWAINDASTSDFMRQFYAALEQRKSKAEALQIAQLALLCGGAKCDGAPSRYSRPYYWAPFILTGDWR